MLDRWYRIWQEIIKIASEAEPVDCAEAFYDDLSSRTMLHNLYQITVNDGIEDSRKAAIAVGSADLLGIMQEDPGDWFKMQATVDDDFIQTAAESRLDFIADKNWAEADRIRDELLEQGIQLKDSKDPETGERVTTWEVKR